MDFVQMRPVALMSGSELLAAADAIHATRATIESYELQVLARLDELGYAEEVGAHDTVRLISDRHRIDTLVVRAKLKLARALPKYPAVAAALPDPFAPTSRVPLPNTAPTLTGTAIAALPAGVAVVAPPPTLTATAARTTAVVATLALGAIAHVGVVVGRYRCFCTPGRQRRSCRSSTRSRPV